MSRFHLFLAVLAAAGLAAESRGGWATDYAVFGNDSLTFLGFAKVSGGPAGSNGNVHHQGGSGEFDGLRGGGALNPTPPTSWTARQNVFGDVVFNSAVTINALSNITGSVHSGGAVSIGGNAASHGVGGNIIAIGPVNVLSYNVIGGSITSGGDLSLVNGCQVAGNLGANGNVTLGVSSHVAGTVTHAGSLTIGGLSSVGGNVIGPVSPNPIAYAPTLVPPATVFAAGGADLDLAVFADRTLAPGQYGTMTLRGSNKVRLTGGDYYFNAIASPGTFTDLHLDLTHGPINVFVTGDVQFQRVRAYVNGADYTLADPALAADVCFESHGNIAMSGNFFGSLFAPQGDIATGTIGSVVGSVISGHNVTIGSSTSIQDAKTTYVPSSYLIAAVPEPSALALIAVALCSVALAIRARRRQHSE
jgi:predicted acyltransferase (DUF342 family)